jgi:hypothetical protein
MAREATNTGATHTGATHTGAGAEGSGLLDMRALAEPPAPVPPGDRWSLDDVLPVPPPTSPAGLGAPLPPAPPAAPPRAPSRSLRSLSLAVATFAFMGVAAAAVPRLVPPPAPTPMVLLEVPPASAPAVAREPLAGPAASADPEEAPTPEIAVEVEAGREARGAVPPRPRPRPRPAPPVDAPPAPIATPVITPRPTPPARLPAMPSRPRVASAFADATPALRACGARGRVDVRVVFRPDGRVQHAQVQQGSITGPTASCVARELRGLRVPAFSNPSFAVTYPYRL